MSQEDRQSGLLLVGLGAGIAYAAFAATFRGPRRRFWQRMTKTGVTLGALAVVGEPQVLRTRPRAGHVVAGGLIASGLYLVFAVGDRAARRVMPRGSENIGDIYALRRLRPASELALRLGIAIAPAEELFWRGLMQRRLTRRFGPVGGAAASTALYGGAHLITGNPTLVGAASMAGAAWSALAALDVPMPALIISHIIWDIWIFLVQPTEAPPRVS